MNMRLAIAALFVASFCSYVLYPGIISFIDKNSEQFNHQKRITQAEISALDLE